MITLPITQMQLALGMLIAELWILSDQKYTVMIGSEAYFSYAVAGAVGLFFLFLYFALRFSYSVQFREEKIKLGRSTSQKILTKKV